MAWVIVLWGNYTVIRFLCVGLGLVVCGFYFWGECKDFFCVWGFIPNSPLFFLPFYIYVLEECFGEFSIVCLSHCPEGIFS